MSYFSESWQERRRNRLNRYAKLFKGRIVPGLKSSDPTAKAKAQKSLGTVIRTADKWNKRGAKGGAGGKIRNDPKSINNLLKSYSKKTPSMGKAKTRFWKEEGDSRAKLLTKTGTLRRASMKASGLSKFYNDQGLEAVGRFWSKTAKADKKAAHSMLRKARNAKKPNLPESIFDVLESNRARRRKTSLMRSVARDADPSRNKGDWRSKLNADKIINRKRDKRNLSDYSAKAKEARQDNFSDTKSAEKNRKNAVAASKNLTKIKGDYPGKGSDKRDFSYYKDAVNRQRQSRLLMRHNKAKKLLP